MITISSSSDSNSHPLQPINPNHEVTVGWDPALLSFFAQVRDTTQDEEAPYLLWLGTPPNEVHDVEELRRLIAPFAVLPYETEVKLRAAAD